MTKKEQKPLPFLWIFVRGLAMGTADVIPGVSGGTIALITGIYPRLIRTIESFHFDHGLALLRLVCFFYNAPKRGAALSKLKGLDWAFLVPLLSGIFCALVVMVRIIPFLLDHYAFFTYAFFNGLILLSITIPLRQMRKGWQEFAVLLLFGTFFFFLTSLEKSSVGNAHPLIVLLSGALAICVMILPGISGSFVLVLLGQYKLITEAARDGELSVLAFFGLGIVIGILSFVRILRFFIDRFFSLTMAALTGMMIGSLNGIWPLRFATQSLTQIELWLGGISMVLAGAFIVLLMEYLSRKWGDLEIAPSK